MEDKDHDAKIVVGVEFVSTEGKDHNAKIVAGVIFVSTTGKNQVAKIVAGIRFVNMKGKGLRAKIVAEARFVGTAGKDQAISDPISIVLEQRKSRLYFRAEGGVKKNGFVAKMFVRF